MSRALVEIMLPHETEPPLTASELAQLNESHEILAEPAPHSRLGQQVLRLQQHGLYKAAEAVKVCGRIGEKSTYKCLRESRKIIRAHRRFCCLQCDRSNSARLFREHRAYAERLLTGSTLQRVIFRANQTPLSTPGIRDLEEAIVAVVRLWLSGLYQWGFKGLTHFENGALVVKAMIALPLGISLPSNLQSIPGVAIEIGSRISVTGFEALLADILSPTVVEGHGLLRADLMAAFSSGNHFRNLGVFYGLVSRNRQEQKKQILHLTSTQQSGAGSAEPQRVVAKSQAWCPHCGPICPRVAVSYEALDDPENSREYKLTERDPVWDTMRELERRRYWF